MTVDVVVLAESHGQAVDTGVAASLEMIEDDAFSVTAAPLTELPNGWGLNDNPWAEDGIEEGSLNIENLIDSGYAPVFHAEEER